MSLTARQIDQLEDTRVLAVSTAQGLYGTETAKRHASGLMHRAMTAFGAGDIGEAVWLG